MTRAKQSDHLTGPTRKEPSPAKPTSLRLSPEAVNLRDALSAQLGISKAAVVEMAIRVLAKREGVGAKVAER